MSDDEIRCERCGHTTVSWGAQACAWWPEGCQGDDKRVCPDCQTPEEVRELAGLGCAAAAFRAAAWIDDLPLHDTAG